MCRARHETVTTTETCTALTNTRAQIWRPQGLPPPLPRRDNSLAAVGRCSKDGQIPFILKSTTMDRLRNKVVCFFFSLSLFLPLPLSLSISSETLHFQILGPYCSVIQHCPLHNVGMIWLQRSNFGTEQIIVHMQGGGEWCKRDSLTFINPTDNLGC